MAIPLRRSLAKLTLTILECEPLIKVYSHPRSGTHFLEKFIGLNFYSNINLERKPIVWGHWSNRQVNKDGYDYQRLFGNHFFPSEHHNQKGKYIYIIRDPRAVAYSIWKTKNFLSAKDSNLSFSEFIRVKLDWVGSPACKTIPKWNIAQHWSHHVANWLRYSISGKNIMIVTYEDLKLYPEKVFSDILKKFFPMTFAKRKIISPRIKVVKEKTGLLPNQASIDAWKSVFTEEDELFLIRQIEHKFFLRDHLSYQF